MSVQPIRPSGDERVQHKTTVLNGFTYHYLYAVPESGTWTDTVFLVCVPSSHQKPRISVQGPAWSSQGTYICTNHQLWATATKRVS